MTNFDKRGILIAEDLISSLLKSKNGLDFKTNQQRKEANEMKTFGRLREEIRKKFKTFDDFASALGKSESALSLKLNGKSEWKRDEMEATCRLLGIPVSQVGEYFFYD